MPCGEDTWKKILDLLPMFCHSMAEHRQGSGISESHESCHATARGSATTPRALTSSHAWAKPTEDKLKFLSELRVAEAVDVRIKSVNETCRFTLIELTYYTSSSLLILFACVNLQGLEGKGPRRHII